MFRALNSLRRNLTRSRVALVVAPLALAGLAAPMMGAGPWDWHIGRREPRRVEVVVRPQPRVIVQPACVDVVPCDLRITAYQAHGTVMVLVAGSNSTGGYTTSISALDTRDHCPKLVLHNTPGRGICTQAMTPISIQAAFHADRDVSNVRVRIADREIVVPVCDVPCI